MVTLSPLEQKALSAFKERVLKEFQHQILSFKLFGSRARGKGNEFSDLDVLVVIRQPDWSMKRKILDLGWECYWEYDVDISPLVLSENEYNELKGLERNIIKDVEKFGVVL